jgi:NAD(P)-dependent dehydrogenase (short-subunit alcohol dehydrogenase family)
MGAFVQDHVRRAGVAPFGGASATVRERREDLVPAILPFLRGAVSSNRRVVAHFEGGEDAVTFANSRWAESLCQLGTSCPDHFLRTRISPMFVPWQPGPDLRELERLIDDRAAAYRVDYASYYATFATPTSPALRDANPSVVVIPGLGVFGFAKDKREARITTEFYRNAINVMSGATALEDVEFAGVVPQARRPEQAGDFASFHNYVALPRSEAFRIEYWALEEAKLQRMPPEQEFSRRIALVVGAASGIGREAVMELARRGAHVVAADLNAEGARHAAADAAGVSSAEAVVSSGVDLSSPDSIRRAVATAVEAFGGLDIVINTAAIYPTPPPGTPAEATWAQALAVNVASNHRLAEEAARIVRAGRLTASVVLTSSANAVVPKSGSEPYDVSKAAVNHLIRELAIGLGPDIRVNGIAPATVVAGSAMFPRERVIASLRKYDIPFADSDSTETLRDALAAFYARRTITGRPITPADCARAILWLAGEGSARTTGHVIPVDGGLPEAFLR